MWFQSFNDYNTLISAHWMSKRRCGGEGGGAGGGGGAGDVGGGAAGGVGGAQGSLGNEPYLSKVSVMFESWEVKTGENGG